MRKTKLLALLLALFCISASLVGCSEKITVDEIKEALPSLVDKSKILNEIYFGEGFKIALLILSIFLGNSSSFMRISMLRDVSMTTGPC